MFEIAFLTACMALGLWWLTHTNLYRAQRRSGVWTGSGMSYRTGQFAPNQKPEPPQHPGSTE